jgi:hypothetical protein
MLRLSSQEIKGKVRILQCDMTDAYAEMAFRGTITEADMV